MQNQLPNIFDLHVTEALLERVNGLQPDTQPLWGKMDVAQMLAHCCVTYEMIYDAIHPKPNLLMRFILKTLVKPKVVSEKPYTHSMNTAPAFLITNTRDFETEKARLITYIRKTQSLGAEAFDGRESLSFGVLTKQEWSNMLYKHLNHHLSQFGV
ncbi:MAG: DUF1569 domain-containing protein [Chitinophagales bacterium]|nr:DUF1569 domain-containing protein [Chitinophagales bacterium]